ncbi:MAG TPA: alpha/beta hydrolase [Allosphingosinicella sp.]|jgi:hypothetical protein
MLLKLLIIGPIAIYVALSAALYFSQTALLFPTSMVQATGVPAAGSERLELITAEGHRLVGSHIPPSDPRERGKRVILGFGGNAWNAEAAGDYLAGLYPEADVVVFHFRGYAPSGGKPSAAALLADAPLIYDLAAAEFPQARIVAVGFSIGSGVAAHLAGRRPLAGVILVTPFDSLAKLAHSHYPWLPVRLLLRHRMEPAADLSGSAVPVALIQAGGDTLIPPEQALGLRVAGRHIVLDRTVPGVGHNDIYEDPVFRGTMDQALDRFFLAD